MASKAEEACNTRYLFTKNELQGGSVFISYTRLTNNCYVLKTISKRCSVSITMKLPCNVFPQ